VAECAGILPWGQDEAELVAGLQAGSDEAFDWLVTHYHAAVYSLVYRMLGDSADAADTTQEVFLKAFRGIRTFRRGSSLRTWLYRIAVREALNHRRWWWRHRRQQTSIDAETADDRPALHLEALQATPFDQLAAREVQEVVRHALAHLPELFRSAVILRDLEGLSYEEVAEVLEVTMGTVKSRILRGRRALREILAAWLNGHHAAWPASATSASTNRGEAREGGSARSRHGGSVPGHVVYVASGRMSAWGEGSNARPAQLQSGRARGGGR